MRKYFTYGLLALLARLSFVHALEVFPPDYIDLPQGKIVTVVSPNLEPVAISTTLGVSKIASPSTLQCAKNVHYDCPGVQLIPTEFYNASQMNGCGPESEAILTRMFNRVIDVPWAHECCNRHDLCFGRCDSDFSQCNLEFEDCLLRSCPASWNPLEQITCATFEPIYVAAVQSRFGCAAFTNVDIEKPTCRCPVTAAPIRQQGHYRQYFWILDEYTSQQLRSRHHDTITIMIGVDINEVPSAGGELRKSQGKQSGGHKSVPGMEIDFWAFDDDDVTLWITLYNGDLSPKSIDELKEAAKVWSPQAVINFASDVSRTPLYSGMNYLSIMTGGASSNLWNWLFGALTAKCDGWVMQETIRMKGANLAISDGQTVIEEIRTGSVAGQGCNKQLSAYHYIARYGLKAEGNVLSTLPDTSPEEQPATVEPLDLPADNSTSLSSSISTPILPETQMMTSSTELPQDYTTSTSSNVFASISGTMTSAPAGTASTASNEAVKDGLSLGLLSLSLGVLAVLIS